MIVLPPTGALIGLVLPTGVAIAVLWFVPQLLARRTGWRPEVQATFVALFHGPFVALVAAGAAITLDNWIWTANPGLPGVFEPAAVAVIAELALDWTIVGTTTLAVRRHILRDQRRSSRLLQYGVYAAGLFGVVLILLESPALPRVAGGVWALVGFGAGILVTYLVAHIIDVIAQRYFSAVAHREPALETIYRFLRRAILLAVVVIGVAVSTFLNYPGAAGAVTSLLLAAGFLSIVVGLAAQSTLSNLIAGAMVSLSQPFKIGDAVVFPYPNGDWCFVEDIRLNFTVLRTWDLRRLMVPNALFQSSVIVNYTAVDPTMLVIVYVVVPFDADVDRARQIMEEEARKHPDTVRLGNLPVTHVMDFQGGGNQGQGMYGGVDLRLLSAAKDQPTAFQVEKDLLDSIRKRFLAEGIRLAYPTQRVLLDPAPPDLRPTRSGTDVASAGARRAPAGRPAEP